MSICVVRQWFCWSLAAQYQIFLGGKVLAYVSLTVGETLVLNDWMNE